MEWAVVSWLFLLLVSMPLPAWIGGRGRDAVVGQGTPDRKVVERLELRSFDSEHVVQSVVEVATDPRSPEPRGFGLQIEDMPEQSSFPVKLAIAPGVRFDDGLEFAQHAERETTVARNRLVAAHGFCEGPAVGRRQPDKRKMSGRVLGCAPLEVRAQALAQRSRRGRMTGQRIKAGFEPFHPMDEEDGVEPRRKAPNVPGCDRPGEQAIQQAIEDVGAHPELAVEAL